MSDEICPIERAREMHWAGERSHLLTARMAIRVLRTHADLAEGLPALAYRVPKSNHRCHVHAFTQLGGVPRRCLVGPTSTPSGKLSVSTDGGVDRRLARPEGIGRDLA